MFCFLRKSGARDGIRFFLNSAFFFISVPLFSQYAFTGTNQEAYRNILDFQFDKALVLLHKETEKNPDNLIPDYLVNYIDFFTLFTGEDRVMFETLKRNKHIRLNRLERGDKESPYYRFCLAGVNLQWAFIRLKFGEYATAAFEIRRAFLLLKENREQFPDFLPNQIGLGILHIMVGLVPDKYQWLANLAGLEGTIDEGVAELKNVLNYRGDNPVYSLFKPDACFYLAFVDINIENNEEESLSLIQRFDTDPALQQYSQSPLIIYAKSSILMKAGKNDRVIALLQDYTLPSGTHPFLFLHYLEGLSKLNHLDTSAGRYLDQFLQKFKGINYIKSAYQKLAWVDLLKGDTLGYRKTIEKAGKKGNTVVDEDKQAYSEYNSGVAPAIPLLKARLLFDGGYYREALTELLSTPLDQYIRGRKDLTEYTYRLARIYHAVGDYSKATRYYTTTVALGRDLPHYYAANAALNLGWIYEDRGNWMAADTNYRLCTSLDYNEYENSLRQKAKAGLSRLKKYLD